MQHRNRVQGRSERRRLISPHVLSVQYHHYHHHYIISTCGRSQAILREDICVNNETEYLDLGIIHVHGRRKVYTEHLHLQMYIVLDSESQICLQSDQTLVNV
jgi:hypothetical protein